MENESTAKENADEQQMQSSTPENFPQLRGQSNVAENAPDLELPAVTETVTVQPKTFDIVSTDKHKVGLTRFVVFLFLFFYAFFAVLLMANNSRLNHKDRLLSQIVGLSIEERTMQLIYDLQILFMLLAAALGVYALWHKSYRLFIMFSLFSFITIILTFISLTLSIKCYNQMGISIDKRGNMIYLINKNIQSYDWFDITNSSTVFINKLQFEYRCCGGQQGYRDWEVLRPKTIDYGVFPVSCCKPRFGPEFQLEWCSYELVEKMPDCPTAFTRHLIDIQNIFHTMNLLILESLLLQLLSISTFLFLIFYSKKLYY